MASNPDEFARQRALDTYRVVDSLAEDAYDDIVRLASFICDAPIALISLIDRDRQWFKARIGLELLETNRDIAFCDHAIREPGQLMQVPDATQDPRFLGNPLVTGEAGIRFYAGMPLVTPGGAPIGTVCVIDHQPRVLSETQKAGLASLARLTMNLLEAGHRELELGRTAQLAAALATGQSVVPEILVPRDCTIAIFEVQDLAGAANRLGDRALGRALEQLEQALEASLRPEFADSVSHAAGSEEFIVVLHGSNTVPALQKLRANLPAFERANGMRVLSASADSATPDEKLSEVFLRADIALSHAKDEYRARFSMVDG